MARSGIPLNERQHLPQCAGTSKPTDQPIAIPAKPTFSAVSQPKRYEPPCPDAKTKRAGRHHEQQVILRAEAKFRAHQDDEGKAKERTRETADHFEGEITVPELA